MNRLSQITIALMISFLFVFLGAHKVDAQGFSYAEETKDGRIYVFNNMKTYQDWKASGEIGKSITRIGAGANGETIVADSIEALQLYYFKHNLAAEVVEPEKKPIMKVSWKDGKTTIDTDIAQLIISNRIQFRWTDSEILSAILPGVNADDSTSTFRLRRGKTKFEGWFYNKNLTYELQLNWADVINALEDANMNFDLTNGKKLFMIKGGQYKVPFGRQELTSSGSQQFVDRSAVSNLFARGRDLGVQIWGTPMGGKIDWRVGVFNGNGRNVSVDLDGDYQLNARVTFQPWGDVKYSESDFESTDKPLLAVAFDYDSFRQSIASTSATAAVLRDLDTFGFDAVFKYKGFSAYYENFQRTTDDRILNAETDVNGWVFQSGYFIYQRKVEVAARVEQIDPNESVDDDLLKEWGIAVNYFYNKHNLKLQGDYRRIESEAKNTEFDEFRIQLQFIF